jgi:hypothetical protein
MLSFFEATTNRMMSIEGIARTAGIGKLDEVEEYQETSRNGLMELVES